MKAWLLCALLAVSLLAAPVAHASSGPATPQSRLLDVWLDLNLIGIFYPDTTPSTFVPNLKKIARQLNQQPWPIRFGESPRAALKAPAGAVVIKRHPPKETFVLFSRSRRQVWELLDGPTGRMRIFRVVIPN